MRRGHGLKVLTPHTSGVGARWSDGGIEVSSFRYAPAAWEVVGYGRSLRADEALRRGSRWVAPLYALGAWSALRRELRARPYDLLHAHWVVPNGLVAARCGATRRGVRLAVGLHGSDVFLAEGRLVRSWVGRSLQKVRLLTGCSPELVDRVRALGFAGDLWRVIPYGVDTEVFAPAPQRRHIWRQRLGIPDSATVLLAVGRMATKKGFQVLVEALPQVLDPHPEAHLVLAGGGDRLGELRTASEPWAGRVHWPGAVERSTLPDLYRACDLFVLPAVHDPRGNVDGLPNVILEAMSSGLPVVATRVSGIPLAVTHEVEGLLVSEGDSQELARALGRLLADRALGRRLGEAGRHRARRELTWDAVAARYEAAYEAALEDTSWESRPTR